jgi:Na+/H+ antiporter NhaA
LAGRFAPAFPSRREGNGFETSPSFLLLSLILQTALMRPYLLVGIMLWYFVLKSGVHATLAGVALALTVPITPTPAHPEAVDSPLHRLEHGLHHWVAFLIIPIFGFANAGVSFSGMSASSLLNPVPLGIALGLFLGKQIGVFGFSLVVIRSGWVDLPANATWRQFYGVCLLCGIGFTMSLFIGLLAFPTSPELQDGVKIGVLAGSVLSAVGGALLLRLSQPKLKRAYRLIGSAPPELGEEQDQDCKKLESSHQHSKAQEPFGDFRQGCKVSDRADRRA